MNLSIKQQQITTAISLPSLSSLIPRYKKNCPLHAKKIKLEITKKKSGVKNFVYLMFKLGTLMGQTAHRTT